MYFTPMNILIRLPNWLGDMVMSTAFVQAVKNEYPHAAIDLVAKKGIDFLLDYFPAHEKRFIFSKEEFALIENAQADLSNKTGGELKATFVELTKLLPKNDPAKTITEIKIIKNPSKGTGIKSVKRAQ